MDKKYHEPGRFVTFPAFEYNNPREGHRNVFFRDEEEAILCSHKDVATASIEQVWELIKDKKAMTIPHHSAITWLGVKWKHKNDRLERLVEIFSNKNNSEAPGCLRMADRYPTDFHNQSVQTALRLGYKLGIIASTDTHSGRIGRVAKAAVLAPEKTREAIWEALLNRRTYGTTGDRIILDFRLNGHWMGSEIPANPKTRKFTIEVHGTHPIDQIDIVRNGVDIYSFTDCGLDYEGTYEEDDSLDDVFFTNREQTERFVYWYLRVVQKDMNLAWTSPIWMTMPVS